MDVKYMLYIEPYNLEIIIKRYNKRLFNSQQRYMDQVKQLNIKQRFGFGNAHGVQDCSDRDVLL